ncbi:MAG: 4Fe-4S binding protein [Candidatus Riflebacteria bacterium]|nr:4Fe-4S binding protein [Candidatus Riflebacteria bacterium]
MAHITSKSYIKLQHRLDKSPQGAPESDALFRILEHLFTEKEAEYVSVLPIFPFRLEQASKFWKLSLSETAQVLDGLTDKGIILDLKVKDKTVYVLAPTMAGFFEFSLMKMGMKFDKQLLAKLYHQYINQENEFGKRIFELNPNPVRTFIHEDTIQHKDVDQILDYERATLVIEKSSFWAVGICYCRHKMEHLGKSCGHSMNVCMSFNEVGKSLSEHNIAKPSSKSESLEILKKCRDEGLVQIGNNTQDNVSWICNCCGCCCEALLAYKKLGFNPRIETNWFALNDIKQCSSCGICVKKCPCNAISLVKDGVEFPVTYAKIDFEKCIGCGVCSRFCPKNCIKIERRRETKFVPKDSFERYVLAAIDSGTLQNLIFDNYQLWHYGVLRRVLEIIFNLPPVKWLLANRQLQSRFIQAAGNRLYNNSPELFSAKPDYSHPELKPRK